MFLLLSSAVSSNDIDITFNGIDLFSGIRDFGEYFNDIYNKLPFFPRVGKVMGMMLSVFPSKFWLVMIYVVICYVAARIFRRY